MRIGLAATNQSLDELVGLATSMEADGFTSLWFGNTILGDPLVGMAIVGRATTTLELGTSVLQTYPCHPVLQANRVAAVAAAIGRSITVGIGPSHEQAITGMFGLPYDHPGRNTEEYTRILAQLLRGEAVDFDGVDWTAHSPSPVGNGAPLPLLLSAMSPRMLRIAGEFADGTITFLATPKALESHIVHRIRAAAAGAGRPEPRIVAGLPVAVHDDVDEARAAYAGRSAIFDPLPNYQRVIALGGKERAADVLITGNERSVQRQLQALIDAGATDVWVGITPVGPDPVASRARTLDALRDLIG